MIMSPSTGWIEGTSILIAIALIVLIGSCNDWSKDKKFAEINAIAQNGTVPVIRGKAGCSTQVCIWDLVVGDVILLREGDCVPADCIIIDSTNVVVDESNFEGRSDRVEKNVKSDPFLYANSNLVGGHCRAVVAVVGDQSSRK
jgi:Ca2+-transporting ATPase